MKLKLIVAVITVIALAGETGAAPNKKKKAVQKTATNPSAANSKRPASAALKSGSSRRKAKTRSAARTRRGVTRQLAPTADRYKEIQRALADRGYLKTEPNGVWDSNSQQAMRAFQSDRKLDPSGKITAPSLIDLGLGPKRDETVAGHSAGNGNAGPIPGAERDTSPTEP
jgi:peptidoglycan hydrolase-like protein with peptidoglycan-binding domain